jgi:uncharacterized protein (TIGR02266 family)
MQQPERRADPRAEVALEIHFRTAQEFAAGYIRNISGGGIFVRTQQPLPLNRDVQLRFTLPGISHTFTVRGVVIWTNPHPSHSSFPSGMGIKFLNLDSEAEKLIAGFIKDKLPTLVPDQKPSGPGEKPKS